MKFGKNVWVVIRAVILLAICGGVVYKLSSSPELAEVDMKMPTPEGWIEYMGATIFVALGIMIFGGFAILASWLYTKFSGKRPKRGDLSWRVYLSKHVMFFGPRHIHFSGTSPVFVFGFISECLGAVAVGFVVAGIIEGLGVLAAGGIFFGVMAASFFVGNRVALRLFGEDDDDGGSSEAVAKRA
ncbi:hypothetical protein STSP2_00334 [Anaerohalosphaera lusitana]|uniref:Uncharacterized protein n=1 Tax=Anaerohalosphaera lusitana TaxID=1936003 RepID=A0A1U9NGY0_9BACT|nr:hypothetical protein [Anaerohalosphaera lusitana]AQT67191.1 hypothetical protein STSP2_00334 [Anaerohalosphaera lusitana]